MQTWISTLSFDLLLHLFQNRRENVRLFTHALTLQTHVGNAYDYHAILTFWPQSDDSSSFPFTAETHTHRQIHRCNWSLYPCRWQVPAWVTQQLDIWIRNKIHKFSSLVLPIMCPYHIPKQNFWGQSLPVLTPNKYCQNREGNSRNKKKLSKNKSNCNKTYSCWGLIRFSWWSLICNILQHTKALSLPVTLHDNYTWLAAFFPG